MQTMRNWVAGFVCAGLASAAAWGQAVTLKLKYPAGRTDFFEQTDEIERKMTGGQFGNEGLTMKIRQLHGLMRKVESSSQEKAVVSYRFDHLEMGFDSPMMPPMVYDSDLPKQDADAAMVEDIFAAMLGGNVRIEVDSSGAVKSVSGLKEVCERVEAQTAGNMFWMQMKEQYSDDAFGQQMVKSRNSLLPDKEVKPGDTWTSKTSDKAPRIGTMTRDMKCTLKAVEKKDGKSIAMISFEGKISADIQAESQPAEFTIKSFDGTSMGTLQFDIDAGDFVRTESETIMNVAATMPGAAQSNDSGENVTKVLVKVKGMSRNLSEKERAEQKKATAEKAAEKDAKEKAEKEKAAKERAAEKTEKPSEKPEKP